VTIIEKIQSEIENRVITWKLGQIKLGVALAIEDYPKGAVSTALLPSRTAYDAWKEYTMRRYNREEAVRKETRRREAVINRRRGYSSASV